MNNIYYYMTIVTIYSTICVTVFVSCFSLSIPKLVKRSMSFGRSRHIKALETRSYKIWGLDWNGRNIMIKACYRVLFGTGECGDHLKHILKLIIEYIIILVDSPQARRWFTKTPGESLCLSLSGGLLGGELKFWHIPVDSSSFGLMCFTISTGGIPQILWSQASIKVVESDEVQKEAVKAIRCVFV